MLLLLNTCEIGHKLNIQNKRSLAHLLYMDELKLYNSLTDTVKIFSNDIKMIFGFDKCTITNISKGKVENQQRK
jgi:hypothetical protein